MIGLSIPENQWSVWEAKGGSNRREQALKKGSQQISDIESVNGNVPDPAAVCMTYYDHSYLCGVVRQPENDQKAKKECIRFCEEDFSELIISLFVSCFWNRETGLGFVGKMQRFLWQFLIFLRQNLWKKSGEFVWACRESFCIV